MAGEGEPGAGMGGMEVEPDSLPQQFCLRWNNYQSNLTDCFDRLLQTETLVDVTLACDGRSLKAHKVVLSACSPYFQTLFMDNPCGHPIVIMRDIRYCDLKAVVDFMYRGEINVAQDQITALLKVAETLKIRGLTDVSAELPGLSPPQPPSPQPPPPPPPPPPRPPKRPDSHENEVGPKARRRRTGSSSRSTSSSPHTATPPPAAPHSAPAAQPAPGPGPLLADDVDIRPGIAEMIREEERAKLMETSHAWLGASTSSIADSYQYQLQSMWQKCWNTNQTLVHNLRFRERGPLKSWRPETMAEAIFSVLKEGLSLSQAARKYDIPYPTFVLYANRVHNMLGPSADGGADLRPKGRGRPQRILLGVWPDEHIRGVIRAVVFRDHSSPHAHAHAQAHAHAHALAAHHIKEESLPPPTPQPQPPVALLPPPQHQLSLYPALPDGVHVREYGAVSGAVPRDERVSPGAAAAAAAVAAVAHGLRRQMCNMAGVGVGGQHSRHELAAAAAAAAAAAHSAAGSPHAAAAVAMDSPRCSPAPSRPSPSPASLYRDRDDMEAEMCPPRAPSAPLVARNGREPAPSPQPMPLPLPPRSPHVKMEPPPPSARNTAAETI